MSVENFGPRMPVSQMAAPAKPSEETQKLGHQKIKELANLNFPHIAGVKSSGKSHDMKAEQGEGLSFLVKGIQMKGTAQRIRTLRLPQNQTKPKPIKASAPVGNKISFG